MSYKWYFCTFKTPTEVSPNTLGVSNSIKLKIADNTLKTSYQHKYVQPTVDLSTADLFPFAPPAGLRFSQLSIRTRSTAGNSAPQFFGSSTMGSIQVAARLAVLLLLALNPSWHPGLVPCLPLISYDTTGIWHLTSQSNIENPVWIYQATFVLGTTQLQSMDTFVLHTGLQQGRKCFNFF